MFGTHMSRLWTRPFHACQNIDPVTLTLTSESAFRFQKLCLGFENVILAPIPIEGSLLHLAHKCLLTRPLRRHKNFDPYYLDLDLDLRLSSNRRASLSPGNSHLI